MHIQINFPLYICGLLAHLIEHATHLVQGCEFRPHISHRVYIKKRKEKDTILNGLSVTSMSNLCSFNLANDSIILSFTSLPVGLFQLEAKFIVTYRNSKQLTSFNYLTLPIATSSS